MKYILISFLFLSCSVNQKIIKNKRSIASISTETTRKKSKEILDFISEENKIKMEAITLKREELKIEKFLEKCNNSKKCDNYKEILKEIGNQKNNLKRKSKTLNRSSRRESIYSYKPQDDTNSSCTFEDFSPDPYDPLKVLRIKFHYPKTDNPFAPGNFTKEHDGNGDRNYNIVDRSQDYINQLNNLLANNKQGKNFDSPAPPKTRLRYKYSSHGNPSIPTEDLSKYYYYSDEIDGNQWENFNAIDDKDNPYYKLEDHNYHLVFMEPKGSPEIGLTTLKNENEDFVMTNDDNFLVGTFARFKFKKGSGVANGLIPDSPYSLVTSEYASYSLFQKGWNEKQSEGENYHVFRNMSVRDRAKIINHEIGHSLGLHHSWLNSFNRITQDHIGSSLQTSVKCEDHSTETNGWCGDSAGNNVMDYNCSQDSWSPCQLAVVHFNLYNQYEKLLHIPCKSDPNYTTIIPNSESYVYWDAPHHLIGNLVVEKGVTLEIGCSITIAQNASIILEPGAKIIGEDKIKRRSCKLESDSQISQDIGEGTP